MRSDLDPVPKFLDQELESWGPDFAQLVKRSLDLVQAALLFGIQHWPAEQFFVTPRSRRELAVDPPGQDANINHRLYPRLVNPGLASCSSVRFWNRLRQAS